MVWGASQGQQWFGPDGGMSLTYFGTGVSTAVQLGWWGANVSTQCMGARAHRQGNDNDVSNGYGGDPDNNCVRQLVALITGGMHV